MVPVASSGWQQLRHNRPHLFVHLSAVCAGAGGRRTADSATVLLGGILGRGTCTRTCQAPGRRLVSSRGTQFVAPDGRAATSRPASPPTYVSSGLTGFALLDLACRHTYHTLGILLSRHLFTSGVGLRHGLRQLHRWAGGRVESDAVPISNKFNQLNASHRSHAGPTQREKVGGEGTSHEPQRQATLPEPPPPISRHRTPHPAPSNNRGTAHPCDCLLGGLHRLAGNLLGALGCRVEGTRQKARGHRMMTGTKRSPSKGEWALPYPTCAGGGVPHIGSRVDGGLLDALGHCNRASQHRSMVDPQV